MALKFLNHIDLSKNQLQNAVIHPLGTAPASPVEGQIYYNSTVGDKKMYLYDGTSFKAIGDITNVASTTSQLVVTGGGSGDASLALSLAASITNGEAGLVTGDLLFDYIAGGTALVNSITAGTGISVSSSTGAVTITNSDLGSSQSIFKNIIVSGQTTVVAETNNDSLTLVAGSNVTITTDALTDTITFSSANTTYVAGSGLTLTGNSFGHTNIITASNFGDTGITRTLAFGGTFVVPYVTYDGNGHVLTKSNLTLTLPANLDTNTYPTTFAWTGGTTAGPTGSLTGTSPTVSYAAIPSASGTASGIVTTGAQSFAGDKTFANNVVITGNLTVNGTTTTVNTETINLADNIITLNSNFTTGTPTENAGIEILRGSLATTSLLWNETSDRWTFTNDGTTFYNIPISGDASVTSVALTQGNGITVTDTSSGTTKAFTIAANNASETGVGVVELATQAEVNTGTDTGRVVTPATLSTYVAAQIAADSYSVTLTATSGAQTVTHNLGTTDVIVQLFDTVTGETIFTDVVRTSTTVVTVTFATVPTNTVRALVQKID
jgi:hypothetical protein